MAITIASGSPSRAISLDDTGLLVDFLEVNRLISGTVEYLDHRFINDLPPFDQLNPSAENIAKYFYEKVSGGLKSEVAARVSQVQVWETDVSSAVYRSVNLSAEVFGVLLGKRSPLLRQVVQCEDSRYGADRHTSSTIDALDGIDVDHIVLGEIWFVSLRMDAVHRASIDTGCIFHVDTGFCNNVSHEISKERGRLPASQRVSHIIA